jgi:hypothetical protein
VYDGDVTACGDELKQELFEDLLHLGRSSPLAKTESKMSQKDHNKGQTDASNGEYNRPVSHTEEAFTWTSDGIKDVNERLSDYHDGRDNANSQK